MSSELPAVLADNLGFVNDAGERLLAGVDLRVERGESVGLVGAAGVGKTLLLKLLHGLVRANLGEAWLLGERTQWLARRRLLELWRRAGFVFGEGALLSNLTIRANILLPLLYRRGLDRWAFGQRAEALLAALHLEAVAGARPGGMGLGVRKRAAMARALVVQPEILFADDPFSGTDEQGHDVVVRALSEARRETGLAMVLALSDMHGAAGLCDRVLVLGEGGKLSEVAA